jgi:GNAT superfamily N-acetyltransferase
MAIPMAKQSTGNIEIKTYFPGMLGGIIQEHAVYYNNFWSLDHTFEAQVGEEISQCLAGLKPAKEGIWAAMLEKRFAGSVAIVETEEGARLRWFLVNPVFHGHGLGLLLLEHALRFCRECEYDSIHLWTFRGLEAARRLYMGHGFKLSEENKVCQWGRELYEQRYDLNLNSAEARELNSIL